MKTNPYCFTTVPEINIYDRIPVYSKNARKTDRIDLKDYTNVHGIKVNKKPIAKNFALYIKFLREQ